jgi:hypothetical protein
MKKDTAACQRIRFLWDSESNQKGTITLGTGGYVSLTPLGTINLIRQRRF